MQAIFRRETSPSARVEVPAHMQRAAVEALRLRCLEILASARTKLDGQAAWHGEVLAELDAVQSEIENS